MKTPIRFEDITIRATKGVVCRDVSGVAFDEIEITPASGPVFDLTNARDVKITHARLAAGTEVFLQVNDPRSGGIVIEASDFTAAAKAVVTGEGVATAAVTIK